MTKTNTITLAVTSPSTVIITISIATTMASVMTIELIIINICLVIRFFVAIFGVCIISLLESREQYSSYSSYCSYYDCECYYYCRYSYIIVTIVFIVINTAVLIKNLHHSRVPCKHQLDRLGCLRQFTRPTSLWNKCRAPQTAVRQ